MLRMDLVSACETISFIDSLDFTVDSDYLLAVDSVALGPRWLKLWHQAHSLMCIMLLVVVEHEILLYCTTLYV
jgi:hypothetical protein